MDSARLTGYVYLVTNLVNGKKYVGCTERTVEGRWEEHQALAQRASSFALHAAIRKYGIASFTIETLETILGSHADLMAAEVRSIAFHECIAPKGYNFTKGGDGVDFTVPAVREKHLEAVRKSAVDRKEYFRTRSAADSAWRTAVAESNRRMATDPEWVQANSAGLAKTRESAHANALARDVNYSPEKRIRRAKQRERALRSYHKRKAERAQE